MNYQMGEDICFLLKTLFSFEYFNKSYQQNLIWFLNTNSLLTSGLCGFK